MLYDTFAILHLFNATSTRASACISIEFTMNIEYVFIRFIILKKKQKAAVD
jgi:hypothetical protein